MNGVEDMDWSGASAMGTAEAKDSRQSLKYTLFKKMCKLHNEYCNLPCFTLSDVSEALACLHDDIPFVLRDEGTMITTVWGTTFGNVSYEHFVHSLNLALNQIEVGGKESLRPRHEELEAQINNILKSDDYYDDIDAAWDRIDALIKQHFPNATRVWISEGLDEYSEIIIDDNEEEIYLLVVTDKCEITPITNDYPLFYYLFKIDSWKVFKNE